MDAEVVSKPHRLEFDVFLSFRGEDTRHNITNRLYEALKKEFRVFRDNEGMKRGDELNPSLAAGMEVSAASIVIFSPDYSNSHWCLDELAKLCDLRSPLDRPMFPIFYNVDPSLVRKQSGERFEKHFQEYDENKRYTVEEIQRWRGAMSLVGSLPGYVYEEGKTVEEDMIREYSMIRLVVKWVLAKVSNKPEKLGEYYTAGLESRVEGLMKLVNLQSTSEVQIMGLYGIGGVGKTTLAKCFYNKIVGNFQHKVFISNVRENSSHQDGLVNLQKRFIKGLVCSPPQIEDFNGGLDMIREKVHEKKILMVLDDVDNVDQVVALVGERRWYGEGSLIVITTRDKEILSKLFVNKQYEVNCLNETEALSLFSFHSLRRNKPTDSLLKPSEDSLWKLSKEIVEVLGRLPLALELFGSLLYDKKDKEQWLAAQLNNTQPKDLKDVLTLSFESLEDEEKKVFLDIACLFLKMEIRKEEVVDILKGCGFNAETALTALRQKSLLKIMSDGTFWMHDEIIDMAKQIVRKESHEEPRMQSRLWDRGEIMNVLNNKKGTSSIRGIVLDFEKKFAASNQANNPGIISMLNFLKNKIVGNPKSCEITIPVEHFVPMTKLRLLQINHVELEGNLKLFPYELKWLQWKGCPLQNLPPDFLAGQLAVLDLSESGIRRVQSSRSKRVDENLKVVNLRGCHSLEAVPDLSNHKAIEKLILERCKLLVEVPKPVGDLRTLLHLDLRNCPNLSEFLVDVSGLKRLEKLFLSGCSNLSVLPKNFGAMTCLKELLLDETAIENLPESIYHLENLEKLSLRGCRSFQELPLCIEKLTSLEELYLDRTPLQSLPSSIEYLKNLQKLHLMHCESLSNLPDTINELISLQKLVIDGSAVEELPLVPRSFPCLTEFSAGGCKSLKQVPSSIGGLNTLLHLRLDSTPVETLPEEISKLRFIQKFELRNCKSLKALPNSIGDMDTLQSLYLSGSNIEELPEGFGKLENLVLLEMNKCGSLKRLPDSFGGLKSLRHLFMEETSVVELPESFGNLSNLIVLKMQKKPLLKSSLSNSLGTGVIPNSFGNLLLLEELDACNWGISGKIPDSFEQLSSLKTLKLGNNYFHSLPSSLKGLSNLIQLSMYDCRELTCLPPLPCKLEQLDLSNCFSLEKISDLSELTILHELNLTNCEKVDDIPGLEKLITLKRLYIGGCNSTFSIAVKKRLSKVSFKRLQNLSLPGNKIPDWFQQGPITFSSRPSRKLRGLILAVVVGLKHERDDEDQVKNVVEVDAQILKPDLSIYNDQIDLPGVPRRSSKEQLHIRGYSNLHPMVTLLKDGCTIQVIKREQEVEQDVVVKMHGIHLVYEGDGDVTSNEGCLTISQNLANFFSFSQEGEDDFDGHSTVT